MSLLQLASQGHASHPLTGQPDLSFFQCVVKKTCAFAVESILLDYTPSASWDTWITVPIRRSGDLVQGITFQFTLDTVLQLPASRFGIQIIEKVELYIGELLIDEHIHQWMDIWSQLTMADEEYQKWLRMTSGSGFWSMQADGSYCTTCYVPLLFWFCRHSALALPLIALQNQEVKLKLKLAPWFAFTPLAFPIQSLQPPFAVTRVPTSHTDWLIPEPDPLVFLIVQKEVAARECIWTADGVEISTPFTTPVAITIENTGPQAGCPTFVFQNPDDIRNAIDANGAWFSQPNVRIRLRVSFLGTEDRTIRVNFIYQPRILTLRNVQVMADFVFLSHCERRRLAAEPYECLLYQLQMNPISSGNQCRLYFKNPCRSIIWYQKVGVRLNSPRLALQEVLRDHTFNYHLSSICPLYQASTRARIMFESGHEQLTWRSIEAFQVVFPMHSYIYTSLRDSLNEPGNEQDQQQPRGPRGGFCLYSFRLPWSTCEETKTNWQPDGAFNFSAIDDATIEFQLNTAYTQEQADWLPLFLNVSDAAINTACFAVSYNRLSIRNGMAKLLFHTCG
jgi:hypothetical protein